VQKTGAFLEIVERRGDRVLADEPGTEAAKFVDRGRVFEDACRQLRQAAVTQPEGMGEAVVADEAILVFDQTMAEGDRAQAALVDRQVDIGADVDGAERGFDALRGVEMVTRLDKAQPAGSELIPEIGPAVAVDDDRQILELADQQFALRASMKSRNGCRMRRSGSNAAM
jgi:hypothetical protein